MTSTNPQNTGRLAQSICVVPPPSRFPLSRLADGPSRPSRPSLRAVPTLAALTTALALSWSIDVRAAEESQRSGIATWPGAIADEFRDIAVEGASDLYVPLHTHHLRFAYTPEKISQFNENPWGIGYGRVLSDGNDGSRMLYAMVFKDSHNDWSPMIGYGRIWNMAKAGPVRFGLGYTAFLMSRTDTLGGFPFPAALPIAEIAVGRASVATTYIPGGKGNGNVLFIFGRYTFGKAG
ncbi:Lipid A palmitoyltransferase PagP [Pandoraea iniqua]|uniref:lipid IV(A) palmitoyltransferase PagP n=1 Tax=Pandoraea iniqua TaxID=2508288 RepID=UPI00125286C5|nr:lipid IV(A) palmitoyltransferase PagP [Pandoraea iniqua]VVD90914.1 Lipid A palmitoyltransferase PagP [Pandoraea iniqua]